MDTPRPLKTPLTHGGNIIIDAEGEVVANMTNSALRRGKSNGLQNEHIETIVKAVNCHTNLLETLEQAERVFNVTSIDPLKAFVMIERMKFIIDKAGKEG